MLNSDLFQLFQQLVNTQGVLTFTFFKVKLGSHSDVGYSSMTEVQTVGEETEQATIIFSCLVTVWLI